MENVPLQLLKKTTPLSSNFEKKGAGRVTFPFPIEISTCGSKKCPILFGIILAEIECPHPTYVGQPSLVVVSVFEGEPSIRPFFLHWPESPGPLALDSFQWSY
ncbi:uncharacterized protein LOC126629012 [Malus sylvestris]|uniref:uncharacterized protein LOC126629012 n=1 Tax=Malus sylvestris TaxID=3752 RepID=UPI0021AC4ED1|nr:uncharacterized protein LOC126629012 [Malus sylvestris]